MPIKHPAAFLPIAMSTAALVLVLTHVAVYGAIREPDEGAAAHLWQLLMVGQVPLIGYFALTWIPRAPGRAVRILALQVFAALAACAPVYWFNL